MISIDRKTINVFLMFSKVVLFGIPSIFLFLHEKSGIYRDTICI